MAVVGVPRVMWVVGLGCGLALSSGCCACAAQRAAAGARAVRVDRADRCPATRRRGRCAGDRAARWRSALAGLVFASDGLRATAEPGLAGAVAALGVYVLYMLPVIAHGHWTWSGYDFVNDSAFEMLLAEHIKGYGTALGNIPETSAASSSNSYLTAAIRSARRRCSAPSAGSPTRLPRSLYRASSRARRGGARVALATVPGCSSASAARPWSALRGACGATSPTSTRCRAASRRSACSRRCARPWPCASGDLARASRIAGAATRRGRRGGGARRLQRRRRALPRSARPVPRPRRAGAAAHCRPPRPWAVAGLLARRSRSRRCWRSPR